MKTETKTETKTKCLKNPTCDIYAIFLYGRGFKDIKYHILTSQPVKFLLVNQTSPDQDLKLEFALVFDISYTYLRLQPPKKFFLGIINFSRSNLSFFKISV